MKPTSIYSFHFRKFAVIWFLLLFILVLPGMVAFGQERHIQGKITDKSSGEPVPFANLFLISSGRGTSSDFNGNYELEIRSGEDSVKISCIGYHSSSLSVTLLMGVHGNIQLEPQVVNLKEFVFMSGENPAYDILRKVVKNKKDNDKRSLDYFEYESYNRIEIDINNLDEEDLPSPILEKAFEATDTIHQIREESGKKILPLFISENLSRYYVRNNPEVKKELIQKTHVEGVGVEDGSFISQLLGASFQEYNFYRNWLNIVDKEFVSPIADGWRLYYDYDLADSIMVGGDSCYVVNIFPKNEEDLAFYGTLWITRKDFALKQIDVTIGKSANLNFIEAIKIQQTLIKTSQGPWLPDKSRVIIDVQEPGKGAPGLLVKFYSSAENWIINKLQPDKFYNSPIELAEDHLENNENFWLQARHEPLGYDELKSYEMVRTIRQVPAVRRYTGLIKFFSTGYIRTAKIDYGPALYTYTNNSVEGNRIRLGFRTNEYLSEKWYLRLYGAYGFFDDRFKYGIYGGLIINRKPWTELILAKRYDIDQVGIQAEELTENYIFLAFTRFGNLKQPYLSDNYAVRFRSEFGKGFSYELTLRKEYFKPLFNFAYYRNYGSGNQDIASEYATTTGSIQLRYARDEKFLINGNQRLSTGIVRAPAITFMYTRGFQDIFEGDFTYNKLDLTVEQRINWGPVGVSRCRLMTGKVFEAIPYPLLYNHIGNETMFYTTGAFNTMNFFEFVSDEYFSVRYQHSFEGFLLSRIPLIEKLKWRLVGNANLLWGRASEDSQNLIPEFDLEGNPVLQFESLGLAPFTEVGYGIENIFKFMRIDFFHRLTYLDKPGVKPFGLKISFQVIL